MKDHLLKGEKMKIKIVLLTALLPMIVFGCFNMGLAQSGRQATKQEKKDIFQLILKNDKQVSEYLNNPDTQIKADEYAQGMTVKKIDLNKDGHPEYIVAIKDGFLCGALANCPNWVYRKTGSEYQLLLRTFGRDLLLEKTSSNKFRDLRSEGGNTAFEGSFVNYKFDDNKYLAKGCYTRTYATKGKKEKINAIKCDESDNH
jgi:hypothetical protein